MAKNKLQNKGKGLPQLPSVDLPIFLMIAGFILMASSGLHWYWRARALTPNDNLRFETEIQSVESENARLRPVHISIPSLIDIDINEQHLVDGQWTVDQQVASYLASSARPSEAGNIIIYGHNTKQIFGKLHLVKIGDLIAIDTADGQTHQYLVTDTLEIDPSQIQYLMQKSEETLTVYTCYGFMDRNRWLVIARPASD